MPRDTINNYPRSFAFRLCTADGDRLDAAAAASGTTPGEWARQVVSTALGIAYQRRAMRRRVANAHLLRGILGELGRQGNNVNQIAARLNALRAIDVTTVLAALEAIRAEQTSVVARIVAVLGATETP